VASGSGCIPAAVDSLRGVAAAGKPRASRILTSSPPRKRSTRARPRSHGSSQDSPLQSMQLNVSCEGSKMGIGGVHFYPNSRFGDIGHVFSRSLFPLPRLRELVTLQVKKARPCGVPVTSPSLDNPLSLQRLRRAPFPLAAPSPPPGFARAETRALSNSLAPRVYLRQNVRTFRR